MYKQTNKQTNKQTKNFKKHQPKIKRLYRHQPQPSPTLPPSFALKSIFCCLNFFHFFKLFSVTLHFLW